VREGGAWEKKGGKRQGKGKGGKGRIKRKGEEVMKRKGREEGAREMCEARVHCGLFPSKLGVGLS